jgi:hypothetical protein
MEFRNDQRKEEWDGLEDECKSKDGQIDHDQDYPPVAFILFTSSQAPLTFSLVLLPLTTGEITPLWQRGARGDFLMNMVSQL